MKDSKQGLEIFQDITRIANYTLDLDETLGKIIEVIQRNLPIDACSIYLTDDNRTYAIEIVFPKGAWEAATGM